MGHVQVANSYITGQDVGTLQSIDCTDAGLISFSINIPDIAEWKVDESSWRLNDINDIACEPTFSQDLVTYSGVNVAICDPGDPVSPLDNSKFEYEFVISVSAVAGSATWPVTFAHDHSYVVKCFYNRKLENIMASFQPSRSLSGNDSGKSKLINFK